MSQRILGIDLGTYSVKVAEIERSFKSWSLVGFYERIVSYNDVLTPQQAQTLTLKQMMGDFGLAADQIACPMPGGEIASRIIELPFTNIKKISQTIAFEMENYLPFALEDVLLDYHILQRGETSSHILICYTKRSDMVRFLTDLAKEDVDPKWVSAQPLELASVMMHRGLALEGAYALLDIGHRWTQVVIMENGRLRYFRSIPFGGAGLTEAIAKKLNVPVPEAEKLKLDIGHVGGSAEGDEISRGVKEALEGAFESLFVDLKQTFFAYRDQGGIPVESVYLCGGTSRLEGIDAYLSYHLKRNVSLLDPLDFPENRLAEPDPARPIISLSLGAALRSILPGVPDIQFRRQEFSFKGDVQELGISLRRLGAMAGTIFAFGLAAFIVESWSYSAQNKAITREVARRVEQVLPDAPKGSLVRPASASALLSSKIAEKRDRLARLKEETAGSPLEVLRLVSASIPERSALTVEIDDITIGRSRVKLEGTTDNFEGVDRMKIALEKIPTFKNVAIGNRRKGLGDKIKFDLTVDIVRPTGDVASQAP